MAATSAQAKTFGWASQTFLNSVDDPVSGSSTVVYPRTFAPMS